MLILFLRSMLILLVILVPRIYFKPLERMLFICIFFAQIEVCANGKLNIAVCKKAIDEEISPFLFFGHAIVMIVCVLHHLSKFLEKCWVAYENSFFEFLAGFNLRYSLVVYLCCIPFGTSKKTIEAALVNSSK